MNNNSSLIAFKAISNFTQEIGQIYSAKHRGLKLYCRLINKTTLSHENAIEKHIIVFRNFCSENRDAIKTGNYKDLKPDRISYSSRVYIDIVNIFKESDKETSSAIWKHLLYISALVDPAGKAKQILEENMKSGKSGGTETEFLSNIIDSVEKHVDPSSNPMDAISSIMKSGIFTELIGGMNNGLEGGQLDMGKLMGAVSCMVGTLSQQSGDSEGNEGNEGLPDAMSMLTKMMGSMGGMGGMGGMAGMAGMGGSPKPGMPGAKLPDREKSFEKKKIPVVETIVKKTIQPVVPIIEKNNHPVEQTIVVKQSETPTVHLSLEDKHTTSDIPKLVDV
jgi:hypothetical protein